MGLQVYLVAIGPGFSFPYDGPTHHGIQDISNILNIPEFEIYNISDNKIAECISKNIFKLKGPNYIRLEKGIQPSTFNSNVLMRGYEFYPAKKNNQNVIVTTGYFSQIAKRYVKKTNNCGLINIYQLKNFDQKKIKIILNKFKKILIYDENTFNGGISPILVKLILDHNLSKKKLYFLTCPDDKQIFIYRNDRIKILDDLGIGENALKNKMININKS